MHVYFHRNPITYEIFYVGIGNDQRPYSEYDRSRFWKNYVKKYGKPVVQIVHSESREVCIKWEIFYISMLKRKFEGGHLVNLTPGGDGGCSDDPELRKLASKRTTDYFKNNPDARLAVSEGLKAYYKKNPYKLTANIIKGIKKRNLHYKHSPESIEKMRVGNLGQKRSEETKRRIGLSKFGIKQKTEHIEKCRLLRIGKKRTPEALKNLKLGQIVNHVPVKMINLQTGGLIKSFNSVSGAAEYLKKSGGAANITNACKGKLPYAYGYKWEYASLA